MSAHIPADMPRRYTWKDNIFTWKTGVTVASFVLAICWLIGQSKPEWGFFGFLAAPLADPLGDIGLFIPLHIWMGYYMVKWGLDAQRWHNAALCGINERFSIDKNFGTRRFGPDLLVGIGALTTRRPGRGLPEGYAIVSPLHVQIRDKDIHADLRFMPMKRHEQLPVLICEHLRATGVSPDTPVWWGFPEKYYVPDPETGVSPIVNVINYNKLQNAYHTQNEKVILGMTETIDSLSDARKSADMRRARLPNTPPRRVVAAQQAVEGVEEEG